MLNFGRSDIVMTELEHTALFVKERDVILTSNWWRVVINFETAPYEEIIAKLSEDIQHTRRTVNNNNNQFAPIGELKQVEKLITELEKELTTFKEIFPRTDSKRAILSAAGSVFKFLFGTATIADYESLKDEVNELHSREENIVHLQMLS